MTETRLFPSIEPYNKGTLQVDDIHTIAYEECGNPRGKPVIFIHGGPGGGRQPFVRQFFDPIKYRYIAFDQRGCGESTPHAELRNNTTWDLVNDIEKLREHLNVEKWQVFGGSWGSTLGLVYAINHPDRVTELILRGIFMCRAEELRWYYQEGASHIFPEVFEKYRDFIPADEQHDLITAYSHRLTGNIESTKREAARLWTLWEMSTSQLIPTSDAEQKADDGKFALAFARIENHYFVNNAFMEPNYILNNADKIKDIPTVLVQGRYDVVCPARSAWEVHQKLPNSELIIINDAGHSTLETGTTRALMAAVEKFAE